MAVKFTNNAATTLAAGINSSATSIAVTDGSIFPALSGSDYFYATFDDTTNKEIVKVTARSGNTLTAVRGQDDTTARAFSSGDKAELRIVAALLEDVKTEVTSTLNVDAFTGDGSATAFTLSAAPSSEDNLIVFIEGVYQNPTDFTLSGTTLTLDVAPVNTRKIIAYHVKGLVSGNNLNQDSFTGNGSTTAFTLSIAPIHENNTQIFIDGVYQQKNSYAVSGTTLTLDAAPANGAILEVMTFTQTEVNTLPANFVSGLTEVTAVGADHFMIFDATDSALKKSLVSDVLESATSISTSADATAITIDSSENVTFTAAVTTGTTLSIGGNNNELRFYEGSNYVGFEAPALSADKIWVLPAADGSNGQVLQTNGSGTLSFATVSGTTINNNADNRIITGSGTANTLNGEANLVFDGTNLGVGNASPQVNFVVGDGTNGTGLEVTPNESSGYVNMNAYDRGSSAWRTMNIGGDVVTLNTGGSERMRIDSAGNVGIGETSPKAPGGANATTLTVKANFYAQWISTVSGAAANTTTWRNIVRESGVYQIQTTDDAMSGEQTAYEIDRTSGSNSINYQRWFAGTSEAMRITANGEFLLNRTGIFGSGNTCTAFIQGKSTAAMYVCGTNTSGYQLITFFNGGLNVMGSITHNNTTVTYGGPSDYRLKENVNYDFDATTRLKQLKPARFNWIADSDNIVQDGFLAHEVSAVVPEAVVGTKDATETVSNAVLNTEGNVVAQDITEEEWKAGKEDSTYDADTTWEASHTKIVQQNIDPAKLVPLLVKTIQELEARITTLENA